MRPVRDFERQLNNLGLEATVIASYVYAEMSIQHAASKSKSLLRILNETPTFWRTCYASFQSAAYVALGRVFDLKSPYNIEALIASMEHDMSIFSRSALAARKAAGGFSDPARLQNYVSNVHVLDLSDVRRIRRAVARRRLVYDRAIMPVRHQYLAHRQAHGHESVKRLYNNGKVKEMWQLSGFLYQLHQSLWHLYNNGRKPDLRIRVRLSPKAIYDHPGSYTGPHERIVRDVRILMSLLERRC
jgi:hypothetical protein